MVIDLEEFSFLISVAKGFVCLERSHEITAPL
jgi:hypothetical protein